MSERAPGMKIRPYSMLVSARDDGRRYGPAIRPVDGMALSVGDSPVKNVDRMIGVRRRVSIVSDHHDCLA